VLALASTGCQDGGSTPVASDWGGFTRSQHPRDTQPLKASPGFPTDLGLGKEACWWLMGLSTSPQFFLASWSFLGFRVWCKGQGSKNRAGAGV
jgi:hypothetical protein